MKSADVSVVIPVRNGAPEIRECIETILAQAAPPREIIAIDSGSTDETPDIIGEYPRVTLVKIPQEEFNHGETRNLGARLSSSRFVAMTVQDARPVTNTWIAALMSGVTDDKVAGVCGAQVVPHERDKNPVEWFRPQSRPEISRYQFENSADFLALPSAEKRRVCSWDNVTALYRRDVLLEVPFQKTTFAEDVLWARDAIMAGWALAYNPKARVFHYHDETEEFAFKRAIASMYYRYLSTGDVPNSPSAALGIARVAKCLFSESTLTLAERERWLRYNWRNQRAVRRAIKLFQNAAAKGDAAIASLHEIHCGSAIIAAKSDSQLPI
jgi:glycosyltransferase involved in cell wall biosynthesis